MKILLERKLSSCSESLTCAVCSERFAPQKIRSLLYNGRGLILGDVCPNCLNLNSSKIVHKIRLKGNLLLYHSQIQDDLGLYTEALDFLEAASENIRFPRWYEWLLKSIEIFLAESQEREAAKIGFNNDWYEEKLRLEKIFARDF
jgi:hypothetical protein